MNNISIRYRESNIFTNIGISLSMVGVPLGMYFNYFFPIIRWSPIFMFSSVILIISYKNLFKGKLPSYNKWFTLILVFQLVMLFYGMLSVNLNFQYLTFHLYIISLTIALASNKKNISYQRVIIFVFFISGISTLLGSFLMWQGMITGLKSWELRQEYDDYALEAFTAASGAIINFSSILFLRTKNKLFKLLIWSLFALDIYIIFMSTKRTPVFVAFAITLFFIYKVGFINKKFFLNNLKRVVILLTIFVIAYLNIKSLQILIDKFIYNFYYGVLNILGNTDVSDTNGSAINRFTNREWAFDYIESNFSFFNYVFGAGYMTRWIDNPLLQSYLDMGFIGILFYILLVIIFPIKCYFKTKNLLMLFAVLNCVYNIMATISSGHQYAYIKYVPIVFLAFVMNLKKVHRLKN